MVSAEERRLMLVFTGRDESGQAVRSVTQSLKELKRATAESSDDIKTQQRAYKDSISVIRERQREERVLGLEFRQNHEGFFKTTQIMGQVGGAALKVNSVMQNYNILQTRTLEQNESVNASYDRLNEAIRRYGANSTQAQQAQKGVNKELEQQKRLNQELPFQYVSMGLSVLSLADDMGRLAERFAVFRRQRQLASVGNFEAGGSDAISAALIAAQGSTLTGRLKGLASNRFVRGAAAVAGPATLAINEYRRSQGQDVDLTSKLISVGSMAATGAVIGSPTVIGAPIGAAIGAGAGFAINFREEIANAIGGKGFVSDAEARNNGNGNIQIDNITIYTNQPAQEIQSQLEALKARNR